MLVMKYQTHTQKVTDRIINKLDTTQEGIHELETGQQKLYKPNVKIKEKGQMGESFLYLQDSIKWSCTHVLGIQGEEIERGQRKYSKR